MTNEEIAKRYGITAGDWEQWAEHPEVNQGPSDRNDVVGYTALRGPVIGIADFSMDDDLPYEERVSNAAAAAKVPQMLAILDSIWYGHSFECDALAAIIEPLRENGR